MQAVNFVSRCIKYTPNYYVNQLSVLSLSRRRALAHAPATLRAAYACIWPPAPRESSALYCVFFVPLFIVYTHHGLANRAFSVEEFCFHNHVPAQNVCWEHFAFACRLYAALPRVFRAGDNQTNLKVPNYRGWQESGRYSKTFWCYTEGGKEGSPSST
jgi:hypothetical protein